MDLRLAKFRDKTGRGHGSDLLDVIVELPGRTAASVVFDPVLLRPIDLDLFRSLGNDVDAFLPRQTFGKLVSDIFFHDEGKPFPPGGDVVAFSSTSTGGLSWL